jgi:hypothetical protein
MGTSSSSSGPKSGISFDPPWLNSVASQNAQQDGTTNSPLGIAPVRRFGNARRY